MQLIFSAKTYIVYTQLNFNFIKAWVLESMPGSCLSVMYIGNYFCDRWFSIISWDHHRKQWIVFIIYPFHRRLFISFVVNFIKALVLNTCQEAVSLWCTLRNISVTDGFLSFPGITIESSELFLSSTHSIEDFLFHLLWLWLISTFHFQWAKLTISLVYMSPNQGTLFTSGSLYSIGHCVAS